MLVEVGLVVERALITEGGVHPTAIIKGFDILEDSGRCLSAGGEAATMDEFVFEGAPERLHGGIVIAIGFTAHGGDAVVCGQAGAVTPTGILDAAIRVMK